MHKDEWSDNRNKSENGQKEAGIFDQTVNLSITCLAMARASASAASTSSI
jgi:hypothetical protein